MGAVTGHDGAAVINAVFGLPHNREWSGIKGRVCKISPGRQGSYNLPVLASIGDYAAASALLDRAIVRKNLVACFENEATTTQGPETGGYDATWALLRGLALYALWDDPDLRPMVKSFVWRGALLGSLVNYKGVSCMVGGRASDCGNVVADVCTALLIGLPVKKSEKWWRTKGNEGAIFLATWLSEHGRDALCTAQQRAEMRSWVLHGSTSPVAFEELDIHLAVEVRRWADRVVGWCPEYFESYTDRNDLAKVIGQVDAAGAKCRLEPHSKPVSTTDWQLWVDGGSVWALPGTLSDVAVAYRPGRGWAYRGTMGVVATDEAPLPKIESEWLPQGGPVPRPPKPETEVKEPNWIRAEFHLQYAAENLGMVRALVEARQRPLECAAILDLEHATDPGVTQHLRRALAALRGEI